MVELKKETDPEIQEFFNFREQLIVQDDIVYKGEKIVVPASLRPEYLKQIHQGHPGTEAVCEMYSVGRHYPKILTPRCHSARCATPTSNINRKSL